MEPALLSPPFGLQSLTREVVALGSARQAGDLALYVGSRTGPGDGFVCAHPARRPGAGWA